MTDHDPLAPIEVLVQRWWQNGPRDVDARALLTQLRDALAEAREAVEGLVAERDYAERKAERYGDRWTDATIRHQAAEAERDRLREALADAHTEHWLAGREVGRQELALLRAALAQPATDEEAGQ